MSQHAQDVHEDASVLDTVILQPVDDHPPDAHRASRGRNTEKTALVSAGPFEAADYFVAFRDLLVDGEDDIGKSCAHGANGVLQTVKSGTLPRQWNLFDHVFPDIFRGCFDVSFCDHFKTRYKEKKIAYLNVKFFSMKGSKISCTKQQVEAKLKMVKLNFVGLFHYTVPPDN